MRPLFLSLVCDFCDGLAAEEDVWDLGFVVWRGRPMPTEEYVFATREDAETWRQMNGMVGSPILPVRAPVKFRWRKSTGTLKSVVIADRLVMIYPDRRFPAGPYRASLVRE
jgi:hypothetical protein